MAPFVAVAGKSDLLEIKKKKKGLDLIKGDVKKGWKYKTAYAYK